MEHTRFVRYIRDNSILSDFYEILSGIVLSLLDHTRVGKSDYTPLRCKRYRSVRCTPLVF